ncbi:ABC transporter permease [Streptomyces sp. NPDC090106]|uniref:ABC transporter permease n=1 Tax=Streptomyces sp. NPDC090106 TaxID=3365946 RepID=UPI003810E2EB
MNRAWARSLLGWALAATAVGALWVGLSADSGVPALLLPAPHRVLDSFLDDVLTPWHALPVTLVRASVGTAVGLLLGTSLALVAYMFPALEHLTRTFGMVMRCVPIIALAPTITVIVGFGWTAAVITTVVMSFFPAFALVTGALHRIPVGFAHLTAAAGGRRWRALWHVGVPMALPEFVLAARLTSCMAVLACMTAEYLTANDGLGASLAHAQALMATQTVWAILLTSTVFSLLAWTVGEHVDRRVRDHLSLDRA